MLNRCRGPSSLNIWSIGWMKNRAEQLVWMNFKLGCLWMSCTRFSPSGSPQFGKDSQWNPFRSITVRFIGLSSSPGLMMSHGSRASSGSGFNGFENRRSTASLVALVPYLSACLFSQPGGAEFGSTREFRGMYGKGKGIAPWDAPNRSRAPSGRARPRYRVTCGGRLGGR